MNKVSESIWSNGRVTIPMAKVQHIERRPHDAGMVVMDTTTWNTEQVDYNNGIYLDASEAKSFLAAWCMFRAELEGNIDNDLSNPTTHENLHKEFVRAVKLLRRAIAFDPPVSSTIEVSKFLEDHRDVET